MLVHVWRFFGEASDCDLNIVPVCAIRLLKVVFTECVDNFSIDFIVNENQFLIRVIAAFRLMMNSLSRLARLCNEIVGYPFKVRVLSNSPSFFLQVDRIEHRWSFLMCSLRMNASLQLLGRWE